MTTIWWLSCLKRASRGRGSKKSYSCLLCACQPQWLRAIFCPKIRDDFIACALQKKKGKVSSEAEFPQGRWQRSRAKLLPLFLPEVSAAGWQDLQASRWEQENSSSPGCSLALSPLPICTCCTLFTVFYWLPFYLLLTGCLPRGERDGLQEYFQLFCTLLLSSFGVFNNLYLFCPLHKKYQQQQKNNQQRMQM